MRQVHPPFSVSSTCELRAESPGCEGNKLKMIKKSISSGGEGNAKRKETKFGEQLR